MRKKDFFFTVVSLFSIITGILLCFYDFIIITLNPGTFLDNLTSFSHIWLIPGIYLIHAGIFRLKKQNSFFSSLPKAVKITEVILIFLFVIISIPCLYFILTPDQNPQPNADYVFLLGGGIDKNGVLPTNVLYRCETAVNYLQNNPNTQVIVTGGTLKFLPFPEAPAIKAALEEKEDINRLLDEGMIPAMREIGDKFSRNEAYVPELLIAARAMQTGLALIEPLIAASGRKSIGKIAIGTVKGDLHDIGKNLVAIMLKGAGYDVIDLGVNCDTAKYDNAVKQGADIVACSSLLTTTMPYMKEVVEHFKGTNVKVIIGGAPVTQAFADEIGADGYSEDANGAVKLVDSLYHRAC